MSAPPPPTNKGKKFPAEPLTNAEVRALLGAASNRSSSGIRQRALIGVLYGAGLRIAEALALYPRDIDTRRNQVRVREGKGRKARTVPIDADAGALVDLWMANREKYGLTGRQPVFCAYSGDTAGKALDPRYVRNALARLAARAGIEKRVHPHGLRHSLASELVDRRVPLHNISAQLGHSSTATTDTYLRKITSAELGERMSQLNLLRDTDDLGGE